MQKKPMSKSKKPNKALRKTDVSGEYCPICKSNDLVDIDDHYTKCCKCGFSFVG
jgi:ribosomal protein L37AE/L43A